MKIIKGSHLTATSRRHIKYLLEQDDVQIGEWYKVNRKIWKLEGKTGQFDVVHKEYFNGITGREARIYRTTIEV